MNPYFTNLVLQENSYHGQPVHIFRSGQDHLVTLPNNVPAPHFQMQNFATPGVKWQDLHQQEPLDFNIDPAVSHVQSKGACETKTVSSSTKSADSQSSKEQVFVIGSAFSLADDHESVSALRGPDSLKTGSNDGCQLIQAVILDELRAQPVSTSVPTLQSSQEPQICIGAVFSLAENHIEHKDQQGKDGDTNRFTTKATGSQETAKKCKATQHIKCRRKRKKIAKSVQNHPPTSAAVSHDLSALFSKNPTINRALKTHVVSHSSVSDMSTHVNYILPQAITADHITTSATLEPVSSDAVKRAVTNSAMPLLSSAMPTPITSSTVTNTRDTFSRSSNNRQGPNLKPESEVGHKEKLRIEDKSEKPVELEDIDSVSQLRPHTSESKKPEVVDLDAEDIDDCMLVKIDFSRYFPYGSKIHNSKVVIDDSDNDQDVADLTVESLNKDLPSQSVAHSGCDAGPASSRQTVSSKCKTPFAAVCSTVGANENIAYEFTDPLNAEDVESETEPSLNNNLEQAMQCEHNSELLLPEEGNGSTGHIIDVTQKSLSYDTNPPKPAGMELHVEEETSLSADTEYTPAKLLTSPKFSRPDYNISTQVPEPAKCHVSVSPASSSEFKNLLSGDETSKRDMKKSMSFKTLTGIGNANSVVSVFSTNDGCITLTEQPSELNSSIEETLNETRDDNIDNDVVILSGLSTSDDGSDMEETLSSSDDDAREYKCKLCSKTFTSRSLFVKHTKMNHHSLSKKTHCKVCTRKFFDLTGLQAHLLQFRFCFIPLTRTRWERKQGPQFCSMCEKVFHSPKDLRKHCFKKMTCRLRYVNVVLENMKGKDNSMEPELSSSAAEFAVSKTLGEQSESKQSANDEVSSSVQDDQSPQDADNQDISLVAVGHSTSNNQVSNTVITPLIECLNCGKTYNDFLGHLFKQQACLNFYEIHSNKCPVQLPVCFQCKTVFESVGLLTGHVCHDLIIHTCETCGLKFTSEQDFHSHNKHSVGCSKTGVICNENYQNGHNTVKLTEQDGTPSSSAPKGVSTSAIEKHSAKQLFPCMICSTTFPMLHLLMEHSYQHEEETHISCEKCNVTFSHYNQFVSHQAFHIRMDKDIETLPEQLELAVLPSVMENSLLSCFDASKCTFRSTGRDKYSQEVLNYSSVCLFCLQDFPSEKAKLDHISSTQACMEIMKYIVENKLFTKDPESSKLYGGFTDPDGCEFCQQKCSDKISHYLQSPCHNRLEEAILRYRAAPYVAEGEEIEPVTFNNKPKEAYANMISALICKKYLKTMTEVEHHQSSCKHSLLLPRSLVEQADMTRPTGFSKQEKSSEESLPEVMQKNQRRKTINQSNNRPHSPVSCKLCYKKYSRLQGFKSHFMMSHNQYDLVRYKEFFNFEPAVVFKQKSSEKIPPEIMQKNQKLKSLSQLPGSCKLCYKKFSQLRHFKLHFKRLHKQYDPERYKELFSFLEPALVLNQGNSSGETPTKVKQHNRNLVTDLHSTKNLHPTEGGSCKLCHERFSALELFKIHFKTSHMQYDPERWMELFSPVESSDHKKDLWSCGKVSSADSVSFKQKEESANFQEKSSSDINDTLKIYDSGSEVFDIDMQNFKNVPSVSEKTADLHPLGSCKLCHKTFTNLQIFKFHLKTSHHRCDTEDHRKLFEPILPLQQRKDFEDNENSGSACPSSLKSEKQNASLHRKSNIDDKYPFKCNENSSFSFKGQKHDSSNNSSIGDNCGDAIISVVDNCEHICQTRFSEVSVYQTHLRTHLKQCSINVHDGVHPETKSTIEFEPVMEVKNMEGCMNAKVKSEENDSLIDLTDEEMLLNQEETLHPDSTTTDFKMSQAVIQNERTNAQNVSAEWVNSLTHSSVKLSTLDWGVAKLKRLEVSSESAASTAGTSKPNGHASLLRGSLTGCISDGNTCDASSASNHNEYIMDTVSSSAGIFNGNDDVPVKSEEDVIDLEDSDTENIVHHIVKAYDNNGMSFLNAKDIIKYTYETSDFIQRPPEFSDLSVHQIPKSLKRKIYEIGQEQTVELERSQMTQGTLLLRDSELTDHVREEHSDISENDFEVLILKTEPAASSHECDSLNFISVSSETSLNHAKRVRELFVFPHGQHQTRSESNVQD